MLEPNLYWADVPPNDFTDGKRSLRAEFGGYGMVVWPDFSYGGIIIDATEGVRDSGWRWRVERADDGEILLGGWCDTIKLAKAWAYAVASAIVKERDRA